MEQGTLSSPEMTSIMRQINNQLEPIKVMLVHRKAELSKDNWLNFVSDTRQSIITHPDQYLENHLCKNLVTQIIIEQIFEKFLKHEGRAVW